MRGGKGSYSDDFCCSLDLILKGFIQIVVIILEESQYQMQIQKKNSYLDQYKILKTLGAGYHAQVKLGEDQQGRLVAIKKYKKETATLETLKHELNVMKALDHQNLVKLISVRENATYKKRDQTTYNCFAIVLEYVGGGELFDFVADTGKFSEKVTRTYFHQMMNGLHYLHNKGYAHRDIKPENVLLSNLYILKIADFGFACDLQGKDKSGVLKTKLGTEGYMAPEIPTKIYEGKSVDLFASGVILFIMYAGNPPFEKASPNDPYYKLIKQKRFDIFWKAHCRKRPAGYFSDAFKDLFSKMVAFDPSERPKIEEIASHPWVQEPICSHPEIKLEFTKRQQKLDKVLNQRRIEQEKEKMQKMNAINTQGSANRDTEVVDKKFIEIYNKEFVANRVLPNLEVISKEDLVIENQPAFAVSTLKHFLASHEVQLADEEEELIGDETDVLKVTELTDDGKDKMTARYTYSYEVDETTFEENVEIEFTFGVNKDNKLVIHFERLDGNLLYFKKVIGDIRTKCL